MEVIRGRALMCSDGIRLPGATRAAPSCHLGSAKVFQAGCGAHPPLPPCGGSKMCTLWLSSSDWPIPSPRGGGRSSGGRPTSSHSCCGSLGRGIPSRQASGSRARTVHGAAKADGDKGPTDASLSANANLLPRCHAKSPRNTPPDCSLCGGLAGLNLGGDTYIYPVYPRYPR